ncbi:MAG: tetratricopeptide repeat protein, partial [Chitinophagaceae bacterium]
YSLAESVQVAAEAYLLSTLETRVEIGSAKIVAVYDSFFHYSVNANFGSSGAPLFNRKGELLGLHHAGRGLKENERGYSEGVLIGAIVKEFQNQFALQLKPTSAKVVKILISCSNELAEDGKVVQQYLLDQSASSWSEHGIILKPVWPGQPKQGVNIVEYYQQFIQDCDAFLLISKKWSSFMQSEINYAMDLFQRTGKPLLYVYVKEPRSNVKKIEPMLLRLKIDQRRSIAYYDTTDELINNFNERLKELYELSDGQEDDFIDLQLATAVEESRVYQQQKNWKKAEEVLQEWLSLNPNDLEAVLELSTVYQRQLRWSEAENILQTVLSRENKKSSDVSVKVCLELGKVFRQQNKWHAAEEILQAALQYVRKKSEDRTDLYLELGEVYQRQHRWSDAESILKTAIKTARETSAKTSDVHPLVSNKVRAYLQLSEVYQQQMKWREAEKVLQEATALKTSDNVFIFEELRVLREKLQQRQRVQSGDTVKVSSTMTVFEDEDKSTFGPDIVEFVVGSTDANTDFSKAVLDRKVGEKTMIPYHNAFVEIEILEIIKASSTQ